METKNTDVRASDGLRWLPYYDTPVPVAKITFFIHKIRHIAQFLSDSSATTWKPISRVFSLYLSNVQSTYREFRASPL